MTALQALNEVEPGHPIWVLQLHAARLLTDKEARKLLGVDKLLERSND